jgi:hypothetical protein
MFVPFESISPNARIWIYQANRKFTFEEQEAITNFLKVFTDRWSAHSQALKTSFAIRYNQFIVLAADEDYNSASGCSIDSSVRAIKQIEQNVGVELFNRNLIAFLNQGIVDLVPLNELKQKYSSGAWNEDSLTFNNLVATKGQMESSWISKAADTWLKRYLPSKVAQ